MRPPMRIAVINPNSTQSMTDKAVLAARAAAPGADIVGITCHGSPPPSRGRRMTPSAAPL